MSDIDWCPVCEDSMCEDARYVVHDMCAFGKAINFKCDYPELADLEKKGFLMSTEIDGDIYYAQNCLNFLDGHPIICNLDHSLLSQDQ